MIISLGQEFGIPLDKDDLLILQPPEILELSEHPTAFRKRQRRRSVLDNENKFYIQKKREMECQAPQDYIQVGLGAAMRPSRMQWSEYQTTAEQT